MRRILAVCVMFLLVAGIATAQVIKDGGDKDKEEKDKKTDKEVVRGEVKKVDAEKGVLTLTINGRDEEFRISRDTKITIAVANRVENAKDGLNDSWFKSAEKASGTGRFKVELTRDKTEVTKVHLQTPTSKE